MHVCMCVSVEKPALNKWQTEQGDSFFGDKCAVGDDDDDDDEVLTPAA